MDNYNVLKSIIAKELNCEVNDIKEDSGWNKTLNWDSLAQIGIITSVELKFSIQIENNQIENLKDFTKILKYINKHKKDGA